MKSTVSRILLLSFIFAAVSMGPTKAQESSYLELQAAYLYNFAKYINWPSGLETVNIGIVGDNNEELQIFTSVLKNKKVGGKLLTVKSSSESEVLTSYQILYIPAEGSKRLESITRLVGNKSTLIVTEKDLIKKGATISFLIEDNKLRFKINTEALQQKKLSVSEGLLKLAMPL